MFRRISTKLVVAVLAAVVLPFVAFAWFVDTQMAEKLSRKVVEQSLLGLVNELAGQVDSTVAQCAQDAALWAADPFCTWAIEDSSVPDVSPEHETTSPGSVGGFLGQPDSRASTTETVPLLRWGPEAILARAGGGSSVSGFRPVLTSRFDLYLEYKQVYDVLLLVREDGRLVTCGSRGAHGDLLSLDVLRGLFERDYAEEAWFRGALAGREQRVDPHVSSLLGAVEPGASAAVRYHIGFATPVRKYLEPEHIVGVLYALVNWSQVQRILKDPALGEYFRGLVGEGRYSSAYGWIWSLDREQREAEVIAHKRPELHGKRIGADLELESMVQDVLGSDWGLHRPYPFGGKERSAAFRHCDEQGGFDWVVGVGIDNADIYAQSEKLRVLLIKSTLAVLLVVLVWTLVIARRTTGPILALKEHAARVARGDLRVQTPVRSHDEVGELTLAFNRMTAELEHSREQLIKAEKDAAWREMARQIAHDIKNPLTPMKLSLDLLERARAERSPETESILESTLAMMRRQVEHLREIATDFYEFTGGRKPRLEPLDVTALLSESLELHRAWASELGVKLSQQGHGLALADRAKLRRVLGNLVSNALHAMREGGGELQARVIEESDKVRIEIQDSGAGLSDEARAHLFEPYFTTRSEGTGLGLAIARRAVEEMGGTIELVARPVAEGRGTLARVRLPRA